MVNDKLIYETMHKSLGVIPSSKLLIMKSVYKPLYEVKTSMSQDKLIQIIENLDNISSSIKEYSNGQLSFHDISVRYRKYQFNDFRITIFLRVEGL